MCVDLIGSTVQWVFFKHFSKHYSIIMALVHIDPLIRFKSHGIDLLNNILSFYRSNIPSIFASALAAHN